jgi:glyoxylate reductase
MRYTVVITAELPPIAVQLLAGEFDVVSHSNESVRDEDDMISILAEADAAITLLTDPLTRRVLESNANLRLVANYAVGYNNIDLDAARELGIAVTNTPGVLTEATADLTLALILGVTRRIAEADADVRASGLSPWYPLHMLGSSLQKKRLGIFGMGRIGSAVASRARSFGMEIVHHSRNTGERDGAAFVTFDELLATSDVLSIHAPLTPETHHRFDARAFAAMRRGSFLINTSRGALVDEAALCAALETQHLAGAALDVYENEPEVPARLRAIRSALLVPHIGSATFETRSEMARIAAMNVLSFLKTGRALTPVS